MGFLLSKKYSLAERRNEGSLVLVFLEGCDCAVGVFYLGAVKVATEAAKDTVNIFSSQFALFNTLGRGESFICFGLACQLIYSCNFLVGHYDDCLLVGLSILWILFSILSKSAF